MGAGLFMGNWTMESGNGSTSVGSEFARVICLKNGGQQESVTKTC